MKYEDENWIKIYTRDTPSWLALSWQARGLSLELARKFPKTTGELSLGRKGLEAIAVLVRAQWAEIAPVVQELIDDGRLVYDPARQVIIDPQHVARQTAVASDVIRKRMQRERERLPLAESRDVTPGHAESPKKEEKEKKEEKREIPPLPPVAPPVGGLEPDEGEEVTQVRKRGTRLPENWTPSDKTQAWARAQGIADPLGPLDEFRDFWGALPGARGVKLCWEKTYKNRLRQVGMRPAGRSAARGAEITKQPYDPEAPWMKLPEVG